MTIEDYEPDDIDIMWGRRILRGLKEGALLMYPATKLVYLVSHKEKTIVLLNPESLEDEYSAITHRRSIKVFATIGYMILVNERGIQ